MEGESWQQRRDKIEKIGENMKLIVREEVGKDEGLKLKDKVIDDWRGKFGSKGETNKRI